MVDNPESSSGVGPIPAKSGFPLRSKKPVGPKPGEVVKRPGAGVSFEDLVKEKGLKFSGHATRRIRGRDISPSETIISRLTRAVEQAKAKGVRECLVLVDDEAYIVSIKNRTVVTAIAKDELKERIFTAIDSVVIG